MPNGYIKYQFDEIIKCSDDLEQTINATTEILNELDVLANNALCSWGGRAQEKFVERRETIRKGLVKMIEELSNSKQKIDFAVENMINNELGVTDSVDSLYSTSVF